MGKQGKQSSSLVVSASNIFNGVLFSWFTVVLKMGSLRKLELNDLPLLPTILSSSFSRAQFEDHCEHNKETRIGIIHAGFENWSRMVTNRNCLHLLIAKVWQCHGAALFITGFLKFISCVLSFTGPLILGSIVSYLEGDPTANRNLLAGLFLVSLLITSSIVTTCVNTNFNIRSVAIKTHLIGSLTSIVFLRVLSLPRAALLDMDITDAQGNNLIQIDIDQFTESVKNIHDLWALPMQIIVSFVLLYLEIRIAFLAGICIIVLMIPLNAYIARRIGVSTKFLMENKDIRVRIVSEAFRNICSLKMCGFEELSLRASSKFREEELKYLARRKYLDAWCVVLWVVTPVLVPFATFATAVLLQGDPNSAQEQQTLTASEVMHYLNS